MGLVILLSNLKDYDIFGVIVLTLILLSSMGFSLNVQTFFGGGSPRTGTSNSTSWPTLIVIVFMASRSIQGFTGNYYSKGNFNGSSFNLKGCLAQTFLQKLKQA